MVDVETQRVEAGYARDDRIVNKKSVIVVKDTPIRRVLRAVEKT